MYDGGFNESMKGRSQAVIQMFGLPSRSLGRLMQRCGLEIWGHLVGRCDGGWMNVVDCLYTVSQKNIPDVFSYNSRKHLRIFIIFGRNVTEKASSHMLLYFFTSPT